jgi:hypothetical protein
MPQSRGGSSSGPPRRDRLSMIERNGARSPYRHYKKPGFSLFFLKVDIKMRSLFKNYIL